MPLLTERLILHEIAGLIPKRQAFRGLKPNDGNPFQPIQTIVETLQPVSEALEALAPNVEPHRRPAFDRTVSRIPASRVELMEWLDEQR